jgi:hypothetical protein
MQTTSPSTPVPNPYTPEAERALLDLIALAIPVGPTLDAAARLYDNGPGGSPVAVLGPSDVLSVLTRWEEGAISSDELRSWAQALNLHHCALVGNRYLGYEFGYERGIADVLLKLITAEFWPYNPTLVTQLKRRMEMSDDQNAELTQRYLR